MPRRFRALKHRSMLPRSLRSARTHGRAARPLALTVVLSCAMAGTAHAQQVPVLPGPPGGALVLSLVEPFSASAFSGTVRYAVYDGPEPGVNLDFYWQLTNAGTSAVPIALLAAGDPVAFPATAGLFQVTAPFAIFPAGTRSPTSSRFSPPLEIDFSFTAGPELLPGETSTILVARTSAAAYYPRLVLAISSRAGTANLSIPLPAIPEPTTLWLLGAGVALLARRAPGWRTGSRHA